MNTKRQYFTSFGISIVASLVLVWIAEWIRNPVFSIIGVVFFTQGLIHVYYGLKLRN